MQDEHDSTFGPEGPAPEPRHEPLHEPLPVLPLEPLPGKLPDSLPDSRSNLLPNALRNWQVLEIDGQATAVPEPSIAEQPAGAEPRGEQAEDLRDLQIEDRGDEVIVATLDNRRRQVECGGTAIYAVTVLNNGDRAALFQVQLEGWLDPHWLGDTTAAAMIEPGTRDDAAPAIVAAATRRKRGRRLSLCRHVSAHHNCQDGLSASAHC